MILWSCPSCNKTVAAVELSSGNWKVLCECGVNGPRAATELEAIKAWNKMAMAVQLARAK